MAEKRGSIAFFATYKPPVPLDIFSSPASPATSHDELHMTDGLSSNYNCKVIPPEALKTMLKRPKLSSQATEAVVDSGRVSGLVFVSERDKNLETIHIALRFTKKVVEVFSFNDVYDTYSDVRMEDSGCIAGGYMVGNRTIDHSLVYVSTMEPAKDRREPWTAVYKTNLNTGETKRLTPSGVSDLSPSVSPSGRKIAVASFQGKGWNGEIEDLQTDIFVMNIDKPPLERKRVIRNGGWPTWGSDNVIFFHRKVGKFWGVFRVDISSGDEPVRVTPDGIDAITPAAINETKVAVATIRQKSTFKDVRVEAQYRHIEVFDSTSSKNSIKITQMTRPKTDHFNPFVIDGGKRIGYHCCRSELLKHGDDIQRNFHKLQSPNPDVGLFSMSGVFPTFSKDGSKLAFVDNEFKEVWLADSQGLRVVYEMKDADNIFSPVWNQDPQKDLLYVCVGPSFNSGKTLDICAIPNVSSGARQRRKLTRGFNNAFPSTSPDGKKLVFRSTKDGGKKNYKNLYIMEDAEVGEYGDGKITRLTNGPWIDTHCQWSPTGDWIVFSSTRDKPKTAPETDNGLDPGYFAVFLVKANDPSVVIRVIKSGDNIAGHVNHPFFSPDGKSIAVTADLAAVSVDPISLPLFLHSVRPYGDIFIIDIDSNNINKNKNVKNFKRITHSRYENSPPTWTIFATEDPNATWNLLLNDPYTPTCPCIS
ncbi:uncharacterized protein LOC110622048 [Manihot esculenta]|uniref:Dipeptidylpeptidase IV N-terminal domain-containing protein n=1 Tax=Manihot esculenta TaxID=3983 RepID=A0A2C9V8D6_MANES|nr:uncharacterized protein LOC110622048 [Manihot esculenta]OAY40946.1 hypothetical protein MANES_09G060824v8 [Manihot esculenta]